MPFIQRPDPAFQGVLALTGALFLSYLTVAISLPAVPVHVVQDLGLSNALAGLANGIGFVSTILTRNLAGSLADRIGGKPCMQRGLLVYAAAGVIGLLAGWPALPAPAAYAVLVAGRLLLGVGESLAMVGMIGWAIGMTGPARTGRVMTLIGTGIFGAYTVGGPLGLLLLERTGFAGVMAACTAMPLLGLVAIHRLPAVAPHAGRRESFLRIIGRIWRQGVAVLLQGIGFAALGAFFPLYLFSQGWPGAGWGLTCFGVGFMLVRLAGGGLLDRLGATRVAALSLAVEAGGQYLLWLAPGPASALAGALLSGLGCSLVFPAMGAQVVGLVPPHLRATALGGFAAFQDLAYGLTGPIMGVLADRVGYASVFLVGGVAATLGLGLVAASRRPPAQTA